MTVFNNDISQSNDQMFAAAKTKTDYIRRVFGQDTSKTEVIAARARAIIFSPDGESVIVVKRQRLGQQAYAVIPGGGLEPEDSSALAGVQREIYEELSINPEQIMIFEDSVLIQDEDQWVFIGIANEQFENMELSGPEKERDVTVSGTYELAWAPISELDSINLVPDDIRSMIIEAYAQSNA